ncbi:hypothetical protein MCHI_000427 [Candidatus Magnetoovum chiemensis]|nr:hypothetical protein MCHI_000427 [Candidatus Magnetoovum chiemensis]
MISKLVKHGKINDTVGNDLRKSFGLGTINRAPEEAYHVSMNGESVIHTYNGHGEPELSAKAKEVYPHPDQPRRNKVRAENAKDIEEIAEEIPITKDDFSYIPAIISKPNYMEYRPKLKNDPETIAAVKYFQDGEDVYQMKVVLRIEHDTKELVIQSLYNNKLKTKK